MVERTGLGAVWPRPQSEPLLDEFAEVDQGARCRTCVLSPSKSAPGFRGHPLRADAAGDALPAGFFLDEFEEEAGDVDHAGLVIPSR